VAFTLKINGTPHKVDVEFNHDVLFRGGILQNPSDRIELTHRRECFETRLTALGLPQLCIGVHRLLSSQCHFSSVVAWRSVAVGLAARTMGLVFALEHGVDVTRRPMADVRAILQVEIVTAAARA